MRKRVLSFLTAVMLAVSVCAVYAAAAETRASLTLSSYLVDAMPGDNPGEIVIPYDVCANQTADLVGVSLIKIYKSNGTLVDTITGTEDNGLLRASAIRHRSEYVYSGCVSGTSYYAAVTVYAKIGSNSDTGKVVTNSAKAP